MPVSDTISAVRHLLASSAAVSWTGIDRVELKVGSHGVSLSVLRDLREGDVGPSINDSSLQAALDSNGNNVVPSGITVTLRVPRIMDSLVIAKGIQDLLSIEDAQVREPAAYVLLAEGQQARLFSHIRGQPLADADKTTEHYHQVLDLWGLLQKQAQAEKEGSLLFFGIRRTEIAPGFGLRDLSEEISLKEIAAFINDADRQKTRADIFGAVLSEFLRDQKPANAFHYLVQNSDTFARRLKEGLAIYLAEHSPEKLAEQAQEAGLAFSEKLEKIINGLEAKSLSIPAAVLLAVKEVDVGDGATLVNAVIAVSALTYAVTMVLVDQSQRALLGVLDTTIATKKKELKGKGLEENNPVLKEAFDSLERRSRCATIASKWMCAFSWVPVVSVALAMWLGTAKPATKNSVNVQSVTAPTSLSGTTNQVVPKSPYDLTPIPKSGTNQTVQPTKPANP